MSEHGDTPEVQFDLAYRSYRNAILAFVRGMVRDVAAADDVLQVVFVEFYRKLQTTVIENPRAYLYQAAYFRSLNLLKDRTKAPKSLALADGHLEIAAPAQGDSMESPADVELAYQCLAEIPDEQRQIIEWKILQHMTFQEIATVSRISINTAQTRYRLGMLKMQRAWIARKGLHEND